MEWTQIAAGIGVLAVVLSALGALVSLATNDLFTGSFATDAIVVLALVALAVGGAVLVGRRSDRWTENPDAYW